MKQSRKLKNVSWATGVNLCQVKLFLSEDSPSKVGFQSPENLQPRGSSFLHPNCLMHNICPPGFEFNCAVNSIPLARWKYPPKFLVTHNWLVAAGEESEDAKFQKQREVTVLEAVYPRLSDIPPSPSVSLDDIEESHNDNLTPVVPLIPIEEEMTADTPALTLLCSNPVSMAGNQPLAMIPKNPSINSQGEVKSVISGSVGVDADVAAAASAALAVLMKSNEQGSLIDTNILITILNDSNMIEKLIANGADVKAINSTGPPADVVPISSAAMPAPSITGEDSDNFYPSHEIERKATGNTPVFDTTPEHQIMKWVQSTPTPSFTHSNPSKNPIFHDAFTGAMVAKQVFHPLNQIPERNMVSVASAAKDRNYYKNLVREHGEQVNGQNVHIYNHGRDTKMVHSKNQKPCMYFNSPKGCRNGAACPYKHETSQNWHSGKLTETTPSSKRMRFSPATPGMMT